MYDAAKPVIRRLVLHFNLYLGNGQRIKQTYVLRHSPYETDGLLVTTLVYTLMGRLKANAWQPC